MAKTVGAIFHQNPFVCAVFRLFVRPRAFTAFQHYPVVVDFHIAPFHQNIRTRIDVDCVRAGGRYGMNRCKNMTAEKFHPFAFINMVRPKWRILQVQVGNYGVFTIRQKHQTGTLFVLVGAGRVPRPAFPKGFPRALAIAINRTLTAHHKPVHTVRVDKRGEVFTTLPFDTGIAYGIIRDIVAPFQNSVFRQVQVYALLEKQRARIVHAGRHDHNAAALLRNLVNQRLQRLRVDFTIVRHAVIGDYVRFSQAFERGDFRLIKPTVNRRAVGEKFLHLSVHTFKILQIRRRNLPFAYRFYSFRTSSLRRCCTRNG